MDIRETVLKISHIGTSLIGKSWFQKPSAVFQGQKTKLLQWHQCELFLWSVIGHNNPFTIRRSIRDYTTFKLVL